jgi:hypothetical protein
MSELKVDKVSPRSGNYVALNTVGMKNIIINGDMSIAQRSTSASSITSDGYNTVDRFVTRITSQGTWTQSQSTDVPTGEGFATSLKMDCTTADASPASGDRIIFVQRIEGQNLQYLKKGTASALSLTASFWVRSNKTGTYICEIYDEDNGRSISQSYTVDVTDTWEKKTLTFAGDTSGVLDNDNAESLLFNLWLGAGSTYTSGTLNTSWGTATNANRAVGQVNLADSTSNEWYVTGVQLEAGTTASDFEFLPVDVNLQRCQRYYFVQCDGSVSASQDIGIGTYYTSSDLRASFSFPTTMRTTPTLEVETVTDGYDFRRNGGVDRMDDFLLNNASLSSANILNSTDVTGTAGQSGHLFSDDASCFLAVSAEL